MIGKVQAQYYSQILKILRENPGTSRVQLAKSMSLDRSSITNLINTLLDRGIICHSDGSRVGEKSGRRQIPLEIQSDFGVVAGVQVQQDSYVLMITNLSGKVLHLQKEIIDISGENLIDVLQLVIENIKMEVNKQSYTLLAMGIGVTGIVDYDSGSIRMSKPLYIFDSLEVLPKLQEGNDFPIFLDNDTNCCSWGVLAFSPGRRIRNFLYVLVELEDHPENADEYKRISTGWAFALNGHVYYGDSGSAGEFKSFLCRSHSEEQFSIPYRTRLKAKSDNEIRESFIKELARNIAFTTNILNLSHVFIGGNLHTMSDELSGIIEDEININWLYNSPVDIDLRFSKLKDYPAAVGAAGLAVERLFELPFMRVSSIVQKVFSFQI